MHEGLLSRHCPLVSSYPVCTSSLSGWQSRALAGLGELPAAITVLAELRSVTDSLLATAIPGCWAFPALQQGVGTTAEPRPPSSSLSGLGQWSRGA